MQHETHDSPDVSSLDEQLVNCVRAIIPPLYADYAPAIQDSFAYFLTHLPEIARTLLTRRLVALPDDATPIDQILIVMDLCPTLQKLGQVLARDVRLDEAVRLKLQQLESYPARIDLEQLEAIIHTELGNAIRDYAITIAFGDALEASMAYVVPITWTRPDRTRPERAVLKVLKPNVVEFLDAELIAFREIAGILDERCVAYNLPPIPFQDTFESVEILIRQEADLDAERQNLVDAWNALRSNASIQIPRPLDFSTPRCLAMRYMPGQKITDGAKQLDKRDRIRLARSLANALICDPLLSREEVTLVHGDPHAGNLKYTDDGRVGILDWSLVSRLHRDDRIAMVMIMLGAITFSRSRMEKGLKMMGATFESEEMMHEVLDATIASYRESEGGGLKLLTKIFDDFVRAGIVFPARFTMIRKNIFTIEGVLADIAPEFSLSREFAKRAAKTYALEWPRRVMNRPTSRDFSIPVANTDIFRAFAKTPLSVTRHILDRRRRKKASKEDED